MLQESYPLYVANAPERPNAALAVTNKYSGEIVARVALADEATISRAIGRAVEAVRPMRELPAFARQAALAHCAQRFTDRAEELAESLCLEAGKPIKDARAEVSRLVDTFRIAAEEAVRLYGEVMPLDISPRAAAYRGMWRRVPIGPCSFISPFNFPLNLAAHKVAPAVAAGCPFVLKPASLTPIGALIIGETLAETELPAGAFSILPCARDGARLFCEDERLKLLSFTGSPAVGWELKRRAGKKKVVLELGGNAACVIDSDIRGELLDDAVQRVVIGAFYQSGQSCIGVQRVFIHADIYGEFRDRFVAATRRLKAGDPRDPETFIGPMISASEAVRLYAWITQAVSAGARVLCGGTRDGAMLDATILENVAEHLPLWCEEAFGPVALLAPVRDFDEALRRVNDSAYGLQAGIFTRDLYKAMRAWDELEVGGVIIGDVPSWRVDHMPYGGVKDSGLGREGIRWAIEEMTEIRLLAVRSR
ncbi:MAG: aldehyde dehydrogenase family protein [Candidatus Schekmanbacteria bacterium]|nr:aldehyde dehydrogenase family protein [Candidatus Schekmanbacteria bacterium]